MTFYSILALSAFLISLIGTRLTILTLRRRTVPLSPSNLRGAASPPVPSGGGIAVLFALIICLLIADVPYAVVLALLLLGAVSLLDTLISIPLLVRLLVQVMAVVAAISTVDTTTFGDFFPVWLDRVITGALWLWFANLFKVMDGVDGMSSTEMICIGAGICLLIAMVGVFPSALFTYGLIVAAAGCGFLWWNWQPAKIRLGDVGRLPIGFLLGYLLLLTTTSGYGYATLILPAYYLADGGITLIRRIYKRKNIMVLHTDHYCQLAVRNGRSQDSVARYIFGINILLIFLAMRSAFEPDISIFHLSLAYLSVFMVLGFFAHERPHPESP